MATFPLKIGTDPIFGRFVYPNYPFTADRSSIGDLCKTFFKVQSRIGCACNTDLPIFSKVSEVVTFIDGEWPG